jgi:hypothetical protein
MNQPGLSPADESLASLTETFPAQGPTEGNIVSTPPTVSGPTVLATPAEDFALPNVYERSGQRGFRAGLIREGKLDVTRGEIAHHIIEYGDNPGARAILEGFHVSIHDLSNGVGLAISTGRHSQRYSDAVTSRIQVAQSVEELRDVLDDIGLELKHYVNTGGSLDDWANDQP